MASFATLGFKLGESRNLSGSTGRGLVLSSVTISVLVTYVLSDVPPTPTARLEVTDGKWLPSRRGHYYYNREIRSQST